MKLASDGPRPPTSENSEQFNQLQNLFDKSFKAARIGIWECTLPDETITWTDTVYELFGLEPRSPLTRAATVALYTPESRRKLTEVRNAAIRDGEGFTLDAQINSATGDLRWIRITAIVERQDGIPVRLFGMKQDITAEKTLFEQLRILAETDAVTGLASRAKFESMLDEVVASGASARKALLLIDLDSFKAVNDRLGHQAGDDCLREAARRISQAVPNATLIARLGGDEFAVIHDYGSVNDLEHVCQRVVDKLEWWVGSSANKFKVSASIGAAMILPGIAAKDIFAEADKALYAVKAAGKNGFRLLPISDPIADVA
ncbi:sensor domain-containing diguanylate cyclase [Aliirhizobium smilacinae]|uniref:Sensor domain-containing diguanylate cyclase n=2 Tax=Aliirhizobium smilacinae TaxID=1395944 RepID=A0A5C4XI67_9HYPH|nr:sensor domain-containing diguanylate cyclase [Rhizobium smilacinae]